MTKISVVLPQRSETVPLSVQNSSLMTHSRVYTGIGPFSSLHLLAIFIELSVLLYNLSLRAYKQQYFYCYCL